MVVNLCPVNGLDTPTLQQKKAASSAFWNICISSSSSLNHLFLLFLSLLFHIPSIAYTTIQREEVSRPAKP